MTEDQDFQSYDPYRLISEVVAMLTLSGLKPERLEGRAGDRLAGAGQLLRGLGIEPRITQEAALSRDGHRAYNRRIHGD